MKAQQLSLQGVNQYSNPLDSDGAFLRAINVDSYPFGGIKRRPGYDTYLGTSNGSAVQNLFQWTNDSGSQSYLYAKKGNVLQYYDITAGTGDWTTCGNGTFSGTANVGHTVLENTLMVGDGVGSTRHTTNGTSFTNTTLAPISGGFEQFQQRVWAIKDTTLFASSFGDPTNWSGAGTSTSTSFQIPGEGKLLKLHKTNDKLYVHKAGGNMMSFDGDYLLDMATNFGLTSPESYAEIEDYGFWLNRLGQFGFGGVNKPSLISNAVQPYIYNDFGEGIAGTAFSTAPGGTFKYDYYLSVGDVADDITHEVVSNAIIKYDYSKNMYFLWSFAHKPTAFGAVIDNQGNEFPIFGASNGQVYKFAGTATSDAGTPIESITEMLVSVNQPINWKRWQVYTAFFNPGSKAKIQVGLCDTFRRDQIALKDLGDTTAGAIQYRFQQGSRSKLLYVKTYERSSGPAWQWYGQGVEFEIDDVR